MVYTFDVSNIFDNTELKYLWSTPLSCSDSYLKIKDCGKDSISLVLFHTFFYFVKKLKILEKKTFYFDSKLSTDFAAGPRITVGEVDCTREGSVCTGEGVSGYPTITLYRHGRVEHNYQYNRDFDRY